MQEVPPYCKLAQRSAGVSGEATNADRRLRRSILGEGLLVLLILFVTALLTTTTSPNG